MQTSQRGCCGSEEKPRSSRSCPPHQPQCSRTWSWGSFRLWKKGRQGVTVPLELGPEAGRLWGNLPHDSQALEKGCDVK